MEVYERCLSILLVPKDVIGMYIPMEHTQIVDLGKCVETGVFESHSIVRGPLFRTRVREGWDRHIFKNNCADRYLVVRKGNREFPGESRHDGPLKLRELRVRFRLCVYRLRAVCLPIISRRANKGS
jgi:hypothetical protein